MRSILVNNSVRITNLGRLLGGNLRFPVNMGRIKSKLVKRTARILIKQENQFSGDFEENKKLLKVPMPSKKIRNQIAGYIARLKKKEI